MTYGLLAGIPLVAVMMLPHDPILLIAISVVALGAPMTAATIPAVSLMTNATERAAVTLILATTAVNLAYAVGETIGSPVAAGLSTVAGDLLPLFLIAALMLGTFVVARRGVGSDAEQAETVGVEGSCTEDGTRRRARTGGDHERPAELTRR
jgi:predicted MFS family arabinose efflux permease